MNSYECWHQTFTSGALEANKHWVPAKSRITVYNQSAIYQPLCLYNTALWYKYTPDVQSKCHVSTSHIVLRLLKDRTALLRWIGHSQYKTGLYALTLLCGGKLPFSILVRLLPQISARQLLEQCSRWSSVIKVWREHPEYSARLMQRRDCDAARNDKIHPQCNTHTECIVKGFELQLRLRGTCGFVYNCRPLLIDCEAATPLSRHPTVPAKILPNMEIIIMMII